jgi:phage tail sheath gpL-like
MPISFDQIPANVRRPGVYSEIDNSRALSGVQLLQYDALLIGQKLGAGSAAPLVPLRVTSTEQARQWFGAGSMLLIMVEAALGTGMVGELWCQPLADSQPVRWRSARWRSRARRPRPGQWPYI